MYFLSHLPRVSTECTEVITHTFDKLVGKVSKTYMLSRGGKSGLLLPFKDAHFVVVVVFGTRRYSSNKTGCQHVSLSPSDYLFSKGNSHTCPASPHSTYKLKFLSTTASCNFISLGHIALAASQKNTEPLVVKGNLGEEKDDNV